jgi:hypothetical protein
MPVSLMASETEPKEVASLDSVLSTIRKKQGIVQFGNASKC